MKFPYRRCPSTELQGSSASFQQVWYASADMQGWRTTMEDRHIAALNFSNGLNGWPKVEAYFALFDGHGGSRAVQYACKNLHQRLRFQDIFFKEEYPECLRTALMTIDKEICSRQFQSGSTALATLVVGKTLHIAHIGDSRAVICTAGVAKDLTQAHTVDVSGEWERVLRAGGFIKGKRVCGQLAMTRSLGNFPLKNNATLLPEEQMITGIPDITTYQIQPEDEFLVLASDGIWDCFSSQEVVDIIRYQISLGATLTQACAFICDICLSPEPLSQKGSDNMTIIVVAFLQGRSQSDWMKWITERVQMNVGRTPSTIPQIHGAKKPLQHPAHITTDFNFILSPPAEPVWIRYGPAVVAAWNRSKGT